MSTPFQPTLPAEVPFTDAELNFIEESPSRLYPENQDSNYGLLRKLFTDEIQNLIDQQITMYNERFVVTADQFLDEWEKMMGLPVNPTSRSVAQRKQDVLSRLLRGPFTRSRLRTVVENFITPTFGESVHLTPSGVPLTSGGVPLYSDAIALSSSYRIYEDSQNFSYEVWVVSSVTPDMVGLLRELKRITPASITVTVDNAHANILDYFRTVRGLNPVGFYTLATVNDSSGRANNGTANGGVTAGGVASPGLLNASIGGTDAATDFDGTNDYILIPAHAAYQTRRASIAAWIKPDTLGAGSSFRAAVGATTTQTMLGVYDASRAYASFEIDGVQTGAFSNTGVIAANTTYFLVSTYDGHTIRVYVNGVQVGSFNIAGTAKLANAADTLRIGNSAFSSSFFDGKIDGVQLYNRALTQAEISKLYNTGINVA